MSQVPPSSGSPLSPSGSPYSPAPYGQDSQGANPYAAPGSSPSAYAPAGQAAYGQPYAQQPAYGAGSPVPVYGGPAGLGAGPAPQVRSTTGPKILLTVGLVMLVAAIIAFAVSMSALLNVSGSLSELPRDGSAIATLEKGNVYGIYSNGIASCEVSDPSGAPVDVSSVSGSVSSTVNDQLLISVFTPESSGDYTISCTSGSSNPVYLGLTISGGAAVGGGLGIVGSLLLGVPGLFISIAGFIWLGVRRSQNKQVQAAAGGYPGAQF